MGVTVEELLERLGGELVSGDAETRLGGVEGEGNGPGLYLVLGRRLPRQRLRLRKKQERRSFRLDLFRAAIARWR